MEGHQVKDCTQNAQCVICKELKKESNHRMGSITCSNNRKTSITTMIPSVSAGKVNMVNKDATEVMDYTSNNNE